MKNGPIQEDCEIPPEIAALIPDFGGSNFTPPPAQKAIKEIEDGLEGSGEKMIAAAEAIPRAPVALNGIFKHPPEFTEQEWDIIIAGLKAHLPLYAIAMKVNCERHFLARKIQEKKEVVQVLMDAKEGALDEMEHQLFKAARSGSMAAIIYYLDHQGKSRGYGDQEEAKDTAEDVQIVFGEISQDDLQEAKKKIAEAQKQTTPTLAAELENLETPKAPTAQDLAMAEDLVKAINKESESKPIDITPTAAPPSPPPYANANQGMSDERYDFLENAFSEGGDSPFGSF